MKPEKEENETGQIENKELAGRDKPSCIHYYINYKWLKHFQLKARDDQSGQKSKTTLYTLYKKYTLIIMIQISQK